MRRPQNFVQDDRGAVAVEFALVSLFFVLMLLFIMFISLCVFLSFQLDFATQKAARQVMIGTIQTKAITQTQFRTNYVCAYIPAIMSCSDVIVSLQTVPEAPGPAGYYSFVNASATALTIPVLSNTGQPFSPGSQSAYEYLQVIYPVTFLPAFMTNLVNGGATYNGKPAYLLVSTMAFRNESY